ncbi:hypothetical protein Sjap_019181 [Stephania japonica]|uniref:Uncharacterized protein n=1 Tax=Stephania japonica TaxID=461633 RepID=A0AAP0F3S6_9MAGN
MWMHKSRMPSEIRIRTTIVACFTRTTSSFGVHEIASTFNNNPITDVSSTKRAYVII